MLIGRTVNAWTEYQDIHSVHEQGHLCRRHQTGQHLEAMRTAEEHIDARGASRVG